MSRSVVPFPIIVTSMIALGCSGGPREIDARFKDELVEAREVLEAAYAEGSFPAWMSGGGWGGRAALAPADGS